MNTEPAQQTIAVTDRIRRALERRGVRAEIALSHVDGGPLTPFEVAACDRAIRELDAVERRADGVVTPTGARPGDAAR